MADRRPESAVESGSRALRVTLLADEWGSSKGGLSTINRELAKQLAKLPDVEVTFFLPKCSEEDKNAARDLGVTIKEAEEQPGYEPVDWLASAPESLSIDVVVGHGVKLGRQAQHIRKTHNCKWVQVVHTAPEELSMYKTYEGAVHKGEEKHQAETKLCKMADFVVAIGPKLADNFSAYLRPRKKVFDLTPGIFDEFSHVEQASEDGRTFRVLVFGRGDSEDFELKGYDIAAQAVDALNDSSYRLIFVGAPNGKEEEVKKNLLKRNISPSQLTVRGFRESREKLSDLFCEADLAIMPSRTEGFGLAGVEALSAGLPILVSRNSGFCEALLGKVPFGSNCVVDSEDANVWANAIKHVREKDRQIRLQESEAIRTSYAKQYDWQKQCEDLVKKLRSAIQDSLGGGPDVSACGADSGSGGSTGTGSLPRHDTEAPSGSGDFAGEQNESRMRLLPQNGTRAQTRPKPTSGIQNVKEGTPSDEELEELSREIGDKWKPLGRRLGFTDPELTGFHKDNEEYSTKAYQMLLGWKQRDHPGPSGYRVLYEALSHKLVGRKDLAEGFCCV